MNIKPLKGPAATCSGHPGCGGCASAGQRAETISPIQCLGGRRESEAGREEALCLWLNCTLGVLSRISHGNRPYLERSRLPHELVASLSVLNVRELSPAQLSAAIAVYDDLKGKELEGFSRLAEDPVRQDLNKRPCREVLEVDPVVVLEVTQLPHREPTLHARYQETGWMSPRSVASIPSPNVSDNCNT